MQTVLKRNSRKRSPGGPPVPGVYTLTMKGLTMGKLLAIRTALQEHSTPVGDDVLLSLNKAIINADESNKL